MQRVIDIRRGGDVRRFHTVTMLREHLVSSHSWGVAVIILDIHPEASAALLRAALYHDVAEHVTGDVSAPTKWRYPALSAALSAIEAEVERELGLEVELTPEERALLKFADMTDLVLACLQEVALGNREAAAIVQRGLAHLNNTVQTRACREYLQQLERYAKEQLA